MQARTARCRGADGRIGIAAGSVAACPTSPSRRPASGAAADPPVPRTTKTLLKVNTPRPTAAVFSTAWPAILLVLVVAFLFAMLFPVLGVLLLVTAPPAVLIAFAVAAFKARKIRLTVTDEVVRVSNGKAGYACDRAAGAVGAAGVETEATGAGTANDRPLPAGR